MSIVQNTKENRYGMFSKVGRDTYERYPIIRRKDEILSNKRRMMKVSMFSGLKRNFDLDLEDEEKIDDFPYSEELKNLENRHNKKKKDSEEINIDIEEEEANYTIKKKPKREQPWSKLISREAAGSMGIDFSKIPPVGRYNPKTLRLGGGCRSYERETLKTMPRSHSLAPKNQIGSLTQDENQAKIDDGNSTNDNASVHDEYESSVDVELEKKKSQKKSRNSALRDKHKRLKLLLKNTYDLGPNGRIKSPIGFDKQLGRRDQLTSSHDPNGKRFERREDPLIFSKTKRVGSVSFEKTSGRDAPSMLMVRMKQKGGPSQAPSYQGDSCFDKKNVKGIRFGTTMPRKPLYREIQPTSIELTDIPTLELKYKTKNTFIALSFEKSMPRSRDDSLKIPSYMEKQLNRTRLGITTINEQGLEASNYSKGRFQSVLTSFNSNTKRSKRGKKNNKSLNRSNDSNDLFS